MTFAEYQAQRKTLLNEAETLINSGELENAEAKTAEVEKLDETYEAQAKALANLDALSARAAIKNIGEASVNVTGETVASFGTVPDENKYDSLDYRKAFMQNVLSGTPVPERFWNASETTQTGDIGSVIPTTVLEKIIEKIESVGMILPLITRTNYKGGLSIPTSNVKPVATWVAEGKGSERQKKGTDKIVFSYHKLRCAIAVSLEVDTISLSVFESTFIRNVAEAMTKSLELAVLFGDGSGKPFGILSETPENGQVIAGNGKIEDIEKAETALPMAYESGAVWCMNKSTFMHYATLKDSAGQPIGRTNYGGTTNRPERILLGRQIILCDYMPGYTAAASGDVVAFLFDFSNYILNTNYSMTVKRYEDNETDDFVTKAIMIADGKVVDKNSFVTLTKGALSK